MLVYPLALDNIDKLRPYQRATLAKTYCSKNDKVKDDDPFAFNPNLLKLVGDIDDPKAYVDFLQKPGEFIDP